MFKSIFRLLIFISLCLNAAPSRVALVIGNNSYGGENELYNSINDTDLISKQLKTSGFKVIYKKNVSLKSADEAIKTFQKSLDLESVGLFYFAGHGVEIDGTNYLVPIDAEFESEDKLKRSSLNLKKVVRVFNETKNDLNIIILDACRDNPITPLKKKGLAPFISPDGLFVAYSAQSGHKALDGPKNGNSPFATALSNNILSGMDIEAVFKQTRVDVYNKTQGKQRPSTYSEILTPFYFSNQETRSLKHKKKTPSKVSFKRHKRFIEPALVFIKAGSFIKGNDEEYEASPSHNVTIKKNFYVSAYEVTFEEYDLFCENSGWQKAEDNGWGRGKQPVINVSWNDANAYVKWLSKKSKKKYKLISESQWEYIAKAGTNSTYGYGDDDGVLPKYAWYEDTANGHTHTVGNKNPNKLGIYDLLGNASEWTDNSYCAYTDSEYLNSLNESEDKSVRGGNIFSTYEELQTYKRSGMHKRKSNAYTGFRVVLEE
ncbi:MAG: SUMF1/EgtB/PvdO family nonheme iron enzyme [Campylobacterota bacterium]|nr:SUMF1/EgtB/PvdO family nonheme iron enzyme [Campylobacterota bacterium]